MAEGHPEAGQGEVRRLFTADRDGARWDGFYRPGASGFDAELFRRRCRYAADQVLARVPPDGRLLDLGCGAGPLSALLADAGRTTVAGDLSTDMLRFARTRLAGSGHWPHPLLQADTQRLPFPDAAFDGVVALGVISYVPDRGAALAEIHRILRPGGLLVISYRNRWGRLAFDPDRLARHAGHMVRGSARDRADRAERGAGAFLRPGRIDRLIEAHGFRLDGRHGIGFGPVRFRGRAVLGDRANQRADRVLAPLLGRLDRRGLPLADLQILIARRIGP
ncbi:MAG: class I SAM-dependent methyltransferase [Acidimicrobiales bacterium]